MKRQASSILTQLKRVILTLLGTLFLALGAIGIFVPILPTTPFLLLSAACYLKGSERMYKWLTTNRIFGTYIRNYKEGKGMSPKAKIFTLSLLWISIIPSALFIISINVVQVILIAVCIGVTIHLIRIPTYRKNPMKIAQSESEPLNNRQKRGQAS
jgi:uncharacterized membrane protein YbaN (DUF454 family)